MLTLTQDDRAWLDAYKRKLEDGFPGLVQEIIIFGSKARGDAREDSDLDVLLIIREGDWRVKWRLREIAIDLALGTNSLPTIFPRTVQEWNEGLHERSPFLESVQDEGVAVS